MKHYNFPSHSKKVSNVAVVKSTLSGEKVHTVAQLKKILNNSSEHVNNKFVVKGYVMGFADTDPKNVVKKMEKGTNKVMSLDGK